MSSSRAKSGGTTPVPASKSDGLWVLVPREPLCPLCSTPLDVQRTDTLDGERIASGVCWTCREQMAVEIES